MTTLLRIQSAALALPDQRGELLPQIAPWLILLLALTLVGGVVIFLVRRHLKSGSPASTGGFTLQDLRTLHETGELTDEQFEKAKAHMIGRLKQSQSPAVRAARRPPPVPPDQKPGNHDPSPDHL